MSPDRERFFMGSVTGVVRAVWLLGASAGPKCMRRPDYDLGRTVQSGSIPEYPLRSNRIDGTIRPGIFQLRSYIINYIILSVWCSGTSS